MTQGVDKQIGSLAAIESESHFVEVGLQMLRADFVPASHNTALEQRKCGFDSVRRDAVTILVADVFLRLVIDRFVFSFVEASFDHGGRIARQFVDYFYIGADILFDVLCQRAGLRIFRLENLQIATALPNADNDFFLILAVPNTFASLLSAYVGFVHFNGAIKHRLIYLFMAARMR